MYCPRCNAEVPDGVIVCPVCDAPLGARKQTPTPNETGVSHFAPTGGSDPYAFQPVEETVVETIEVDVVEPAQPDAADGSLEGWTAIVEETIIEKEPSETADTVVSEAFEQFQPSFITLDTDDAQDIPQASPARTATLDQLTPVKPAPEPLADEVVTPADPEPSAVQPAATQPSAEPRCTACGAALEPGAVFCIYCGHKVEVEPEPEPESEPEPAPPATITCPQCGYVNDPDVNFCIACGLKLV